MMFVASCQAYDPTLRTKVARTFHGDVCVEYEDWCLTHVLGQFRVDAVDRVVFELTEDKEKFLRRFWSETLSV